MQNQIAYVLTTLIAVAILVIGCFYVLSSETVLGSFGLAPPAPDARTRPWLRLKGIRDIACGLVLLVLLLYTNQHTVGLVLLVLCLIPFGDMANVLLSGGRKGTALSVHGVTCLVMLCSGLILFHAM